MWIRDSYSPLYLDDSLLPSAPQPAAAPQPASAAPLTEAEQFQREGVDFLNYLKACCGRLGSDADEELVQMRKICASILGFVHNLSLIHIYAAVYRHDDRADLYLQKLSGPQGRGYPLR